MASNNTKFVIRNVTLFDGVGWIKDQDVAFQDGFIVEDTSGEAMNIDGKGTFLIPGLVDSHVHVHDVEDLATLARHGVTTCLDMGTKNIAFLKTLRNQAGLCDVRSAGIPAMPAGSRLTQRPDFPKRLIVSKPEDAKQFVSDRIAEGVDYVKVMMEPEGPDQETVNAVASEAHLHQKKIICHATTCEAIEKAVKARVDVITHAPLEATLADAVASTMKLQRSIAVPTLVKMQTMVSDGETLQYAHARDSTKAMARAGVAIIAGSDANKHGSSSKVSYGDSLWKELELLVDAGMSPREALQSATSLPSIHFALEQRGSVKPGMSADLVMLRADPLENISNICSVQRVWCQGVEVDRADL